MNLTWTVTFYLFIYYLFVCLFVCLFGWFFFWGGGRFTLTAYYYHMYFTNVLKKYAKKMLFIILPIDLVKIEQTENLIQHKIYTFNNLQFIKKYSKSVWNFTEVKFLNYWISFILYHNESKSLWHENKSGMK